MFQLRCAINRRNVSASAEDDFNACDDFFVTVVKCHIVAAAMQYFNMTGLDDKPDHPQLRDDLWLDTLEERRDILQSVTNELVLLFGANFIGEVDDCDDDGHVEESDKVQCYATELLSYGLLYLEFSDAIREGDGLRVLRCWRYLMLVFKVHRRPNYSIEAIHLLAQYHFFCHPVRHNSYFGPGLLIPMVFLVITCLQSSCC